MHANILPFRQDRHNCMKRKVDEPFKKVLEGGRDERRKDDHRHCRIIEIGRPIFDRNYNFSVQKLTELVIFKKSIYSAPEHARSILMVDLNSSK